MYRRTPLTPADNRALRSAAGFEGDVLLVEAERDDVIPHQVIANYRAAFDPRGLAGPIAVALSFCYRLPAVRARVPRGPQGRRCESAATPSL